MRLAAPTAYPTYLNTESRRLSAAPALPVEGRISEPHSRDLPQEETGVRRRPIPTKLNGVQLDFPLLHYVDAQVLLGRLERDYVAWALLGERGNRSATARRLNLTRTTFLRHLKRLGLEDLIPEQDLRRS